jgi:hypothetical protein
MEGRVKGRVKRRDVEKRRMERDGQRSEREGVPTGGGGRTQHCISDVGRSPRPALNVTTHSRSKL